MSGSTLYGLGVAALAGGIALEIYGFYLRVMITGWAPVTNMYETVIWVSLVAAVLSCVLELIYRKVFIALAGSAVALLGTVTAASGAPPGPEHQEPATGVAQQLLAVYSRYLRGIQLRGLCPGLDARADRNGILSDLDLPAVAPVS